MGNKEIGIGAVDHHHLEHGVINEIAGKLEQLTNHLGAHQIDRRVLQRDLKDSAGFTQGKGLEVHLGVSCLRGVQTRGSTLMAA